MTDTTTDEPTILVTGGCGYLGSQLIRDLAADPGLDGTTIRILDNLHRGLVTPLMDLPGNGRFEFIEGDILDPAATRRALNGVHTVVHLAALVKTPFSYDHPEWTTHVNQWGTAGLVDRAVDAGVQNLVYASSASVYGPGGPFTEDDGCRPVGPYCRAKWEGERAVLAAADRGLNATTLRIGTIYGGQTTGIRFDAVPNRLAFLAGTGRPVYVPAPRDHVWPYVHVEDASAALRLVLSDPNRFGGATFNVAERNERVDTLTQILADEGFDQPVLFSDDRGQSHFSLEIDSSRFRSLEWQPQRSLPAGVREILERFTGFHKTAGEAIARID